jgi:hypothetical protein
VAAFFSGPPLPTRRNSEICQIFCHNICESLLFFYATPQSTCSKAKGRKNDDDDGDVIVWWEKVLEILRGQIAYIGEQKFGDSGE